MSENLKKDAFDRLVAGLSSEDRVEMLYSINKNLSPSVDLVEDTTVDSSIKITLRTKYAQESFFYRLILWFRSLFQKKNAESIYNDDIISALARRVNKNHSGLINHKNRILDSLFYERESLIYSLFRYNKYSNRYTNQKNNIISCAEEWESFTRIGNIIKDAVIQSIKGDKS